MGHSAEKTRNHDEIQRWAEERGGQPAIVEGTEDKQDGAGLLRIKFDEKDDDLKEVEWDEFFETFDDRGLTFLYQDKVDGQPSRFFKFIRE